MATQGPNIAGTGVDDSSVGTTTWINPGNITADDGSFATRVQGTVSADGAITHYLKGTNFGFSIPTGATINGVLVEWKKKATTASGSSNRWVDKTVSLVKGGTVSGDNKADTTTNWPTTIAYASYGGSSDLWGITLTDTDVNDSTFGVVLSGNPTVPSDTSNTGSVDAVRITITYTDAGGFVGFYVAFV